MSKRRLSAFFWLLAILGLFWLVTSEKPPESKLAQIEPARLLHESKSNYVKDGDGFVLNGTEYRLWGIDAVELFQSCEMQNGVHYECGRLAKEYLVSLFDAPAISCEPQQQKRSHGRVVARCFLNGEDIGAKIVRKGWAIDYGYFSNGFYKQDEAEARKAKRGIWAGQFETPYEWRKGNADWRQRKDQR